MQSICIGIHVHAEPERLQATLAALRLHTRQNFELLLLSDGPDDATQAALHALRDLPQSGTVEPLGAPACFNRLAAASNSDILVFLESGALVGPDWLDFLLVALADPWNGLAAPSTNRSWNEQAVMRHPHNNPADVVHSAQQVAQRFGSLVRPLGPLHSLADFCYAVRREVIDAIGSADEAYGLGPCWEMDYNIRAARAGLRDVWACGAYVHRSPFTKRRQQEEARRFDASRQLYQNRFCGLRLSGQKTSYERHCRGKACEHFAPRTLIQITLPLQTAGHSSIDEANTPDTTAKPIQLITQAERSPTVQRPSPTEETHQETDELPMVSCIMPTYNRRRFVTQAIAYFLRQDYPHKELIILDDGTDPVGDLVPSDTRITYTRLSQKLTVGAKRNLACEQAKGTIIAHWDDDDWHASQRLSYQVEALLRQNADLCGINRLLFYDPANRQAWQYLYTTNQRVWLSGSTLCYKRDFWMSNRFVNINVGEDARFVWGSRMGRVTILEDANFHVGIIHRENVSPKRTKGAYWHIYQVDAIQALLGSDWDFYHSL